MMQVYYKSSWIKMYVVDASITQMGEKTFTPQIYDQKLKHLKKVKRFKRVKLASKSNGPIVLKNASVYGELIPILNEGLSGRFLVLDIWSGLYDGWNRTEIVGFSDGQKSILELDRALACQHHFIFANTNGGGKTPWYMDSSIFIGLVIGLILVPRHFPRFVPDTLSQQEPVLYYGGLIALSIFFISGSFFFSTKRLARNFLKELDKVAEPAMIARVESSLLAISDEGIGPEEKHANTKLGGSHGASEAN